MNILVTGGCGYVGTMLVPALLDLGHRVTVFDTQWFGNFLESHANLEIVQGDVRNVDEIPIKGHDRIIHLANIANDPAVELNPSLSWEVNVLATQQLVDKAVRLGDLSQFIFASSGSVYGVKEELNVTEDLEPVPISVYNKTKIVAERLLLSYADKTQVHNIRPATVCGYSRRMRLDISVNTLTMQALTKGNIRVFGGEQTRPNINIQDMVRVYVHFLDNPSLPSGCYNAGFENIAIKDMAASISDRIRSEVSVEQSNDPRSYRQNSDKLLSTGFVPEFTVTDAVEQIREKVASGELVDKDIYYNVRSMKELEL